MNRELLSTEIVRQDIERWISEGYSLEKIARKLEDIHLIIMPKEEIREFIKEKLERNI